MVYRCHGRSSKIDSELSKSQEVEMASMDKGGVNAKEGLRQQARFAVRWPVTYWNEGLFGQGTILDVSHIGCQLAGTMPVSVGMLLKLWISPLHKEEHLCVEEARVLWVRDYEFGLELRRLPSTDHRWLAGFLETAERRSSFRQTTAAITDLAEKPLALPVID